MSLVSRLSTA